MSPAETTPQNIVEVVQVSFIVEEGEALSEGLLVAEEVAGLLRLPPTSVYELARTGRLPGVVRLGRLIRFDASALKRFIAEGGQALPGGWRREPR